MYVCIYVLRVCMYIRMYVCNVCMYVCIYIYICNPFYISHGGNQCWRGKTADTDLNHTALTKSSALKEQEGRHWSKAFQSTSSNDALKKKKIRVDGGRRHLSLAGWRALWGRVAGGYVCICIYINIYIYNNNNNNIS
jgi:hypothetical protein